MLDKSVLFNISHVAIGALNGLPWFDHGTAVERAFRQIERLRIKTGSPYALVGQLSGGNQQKTVVGKWLEVAPRVILLDDPTRARCRRQARSLYFWSPVSADAHRSSARPSCRNWSGRAINHVLYRGIASESRER
jgi:hypothetical protein